MKRGTFVAVLTSIVALGCVLVVAALGGLLWTRSILEVEPIAATTTRPVSTSSPVPPSRTYRAAPTTTPSPLPPPSSTSTPQPSIHGTPTLQPVPSLSPEEEQPTTEEQLLRTELPQRDLRFLAQRLRKIDSIPQVVRTAPPVYELGDASTFWVNNVDTMEHTQVTAVLRHITSHLYMWVEEGVSFDQAALVRSAQSFEGRIYPTNRAFFGSEWSPGVDSDIRLHILHSSAERMGSSVAGYYSSSDEYSRLAAPYSNEREMFYVSLSQMAPGTDFYDGVLAHEFQHMIHWANDANEETWVNEGCSQLASYLNGYHPGGFEWLFVTDPDVQLTTWAELGSSGPHYGNSYLFVLYFFERFGAQAMKEVIAHPANGVAGFDAILDRYNLTFKDVFADWLIANFVDNMAKDHSAGSSTGHDSQLHLRYQYPNHSIGPVAIDATHDEYPVVRQSNVRQYAADYVELRGGKDLLIEFWGVDRAALTPVGAHSGRYAWWSNRGDEADTTLTRVFDLSNTDRATLEAWMWFDIEKHWDYAYVQASIDDGKTWDVLAGQLTTTDNPNGNSFGPAYTGQSRDWIQESFDLTPYAGHEVWLRFEYVTDDAVNRAGWLIDDVRIPELGYAEDFESGMAGWETRGFIYSDNRVSQRYHVQLIVLGEGKQQVYLMQLDEEQHGQIALRELADETDRAVLVISALAPVTTEIASYTYAVRPLSN